MYYTQPELRIFLGSMAASERERNLTHGNELSFEEIGSQHFSQVIFFIFFIFYFRKIFLIQITQFFLLPLVSPSQKYLFSFVPFFVLFFSFSFIFFSFRQTTQFSTQLTILLVVVNDPVYFETCKHSSYLYIPIQKMTLRGPLIIVTSN